MSLPGSTCQRSRPPQNMSVSNRCGCSCSSKNGCGIATRDKCHATKVVLTCTAPLPNRVPVIPSQCKCACLLGIVPATLNHVNHVMIKKRQQLIAGERGIYWAIAKGKKEYSKISNKLKLLLLNAFNNHPHVLVWPNTKYTLQVMNADGKKSLVRKELIFHLSGKTHCALNCGT
jgi:hypothetical protein